MSRALQVAGLATSSTASTTTLWLFFGQSALKKEDMLDDEMSSSCHSRSQERSSIADDGQVV